jgi:bifunctional lysine-specific demethylase and histidyl-hydroxylase NO66
MPLDLLPALLGPLDLATFFERYYEREPVHVRAPVAPASPLLTHEALRGALLAQPAPPEGLMAFPEHLDPDLGIAALLADPALLDAYVDAGHPLVWNRARGVSPAVDELAAALSEAFGAQVWPNVYATGEAGTPFEMHFDCHEVLAVHCEGEKTWQISAVRVDRPLDAAEMELAVAAALCARREEACAHPLLEIAVAPGDVVYIPRGQFHNASTPRGRSLHVTFGIRQLAGFDVVKLLATTALGEPLFREYFPAAAADPSGARARALLEEILGRIRDLAGSEELADDLRAARAHLVRRGRAPRA